MGRVFSFDEKNARRIKSLGLGDIIILQDTNGKDVVAIKVGVENPDMVHLEFPKNYFAQVNYQRGEKIGVEGLDLSGADFKK